MVDLPEADRPVNQIVNPCCFRNVFRSRRDSEGCHVILLTPRAGISVTESRLAFTHTVEGCGRSPTLPSRNRCESPSDQEEGKC